MFLTPCVSWSKNEISYTSSFPGDICSVLSSEKPGKSNNTFMPFKDFSASGLDWNHVLWLPNVLQIAVFHAMVFLTQCKGNLSKQHDDEKIWSNVASHQHIRSDWACTI